MNDASNQPPNPDHQRQREILAWASATLHELRLGRRTIRRREGPSATRPPSQPSSRWSRSTTTRPRSPCSTSACWLMPPIRGVWRTSTPPTSGSPTSCAGRRRAWSAWRAHSSRTLLKIQTTRRKRQANPVTRAQDARTEQELLRAMTAALQLLPPGQKVPAPQVAAPQTAALPPRRPDPSNRLDLRGVIMSIWPEPSSTERSIGNRTIH